MYTLRKHGCRTSVPKCLPFLLHQLLLIRRIPPGFSANHGLSCSAVAQLLLGFLRPLYFRLDWDLLTTIRTSLLLPLEVDEQLDIRAEFASDTLEASSGIGELPRIRLDIQASRSRPPACLPHKHSQILRQLTFPISALRWTSFDIDDTISHLLYQSTQPLHPQSRSYLQTQGISVPFVWRTKRAPSVTSGGPKEETFGRKA